MADEKLVADRSVINSLGSLFGTDLPYPQARSNDPVIVETQPEMVTDEVVQTSLAARLTAVNVTVGHVAGNADPFEHTVADIGRWNRILRQRSNRLLHVQTVADIRQAQAQGKIGVIYGFQNSLMLGEDVERVDLFADLGVRVFQLTYNNAVPIGDGSMAPENRGLSPFGRNVVERLNAIGVLCDLSHSGEQTCLDAIRHSRQPVLISHTGCRGVTDNPRNKTDAELRLLAARGGYVGIYFMMFLAASGVARASDVVAHIEHAVNVCGEDHVGIGTDYAVKDMPDLAHYLEVQRKYLEVRRKSGIAPTGEQSGKPFYVVDLTGPDQFRKLERLLRARGHTTNRLEKLFGGNFLRVAREVWGA